MKLTIQQKISVLKHVDIHRLEIIRKGLCYGIYCAIYKTIGESVAYGELSTLIDLFTYKNAERFGARGLPVWFCLNSKGYKQRKRFRNWMIRKYRKQLIYEYFKFIFKRKN